MSYGMGLLIIGLIALFFIGYAFLAMTGVIGSKSERVYAKCNCELDRGDCFDYLEYGTNGIKRDINEYYKCPQHKRELEEKRKVLDKKIKKN